MEAIQIDNLVIMAYAMPDAPRGGIAMATAHRPASDNPIYYTGDTVFAWRPDDDPPPPIRECGSKTTWARPGATVRVTRAAYEQGKR